MKDQNFCNSACPLTRAIGVIGNKWKPLIVHVIRRRSIRFGQLNAHIPIITRKVLTEQLKELEEDGIVTRIAFKELPPRVEYSLTKKGMQLLPIVDQIQEWFINFENTGSEEKQTVIVP